MSEQPVRLDVPEFKRRAEARWLAQELAPILAPILSPLVAEEVMARLTSRPPATSDTCTATVASTGRQCMVPAKYGSDRCGRHQLTPGAALLRSVKNICAGEMDDGSPCTNKSAPGTDYCIFHLRDEGPVTQ